MIFGIMLTMMLSCLQQIYVVIERYDCSDQQQLINASLLPFFTKTNAINFHWLLGDTPPAAATADEIIVVEVVEKSRCGLIAVNDTKKFHVCWFCGP